MSSDLVPFTFDGHDVRTGMVNDESWFKPEERIADR